MNKHSNHIQLVLLLGSLLLLQWLPSSACLSTLVAEGHVDLNPSTATATRSTSRKWARIGPAGVFQSGFVDGPYGLQRQDYALAMDSTSKPWIAYTGASGNSTKRALEIRRWSGGAWLTISIAGLPENQQVNPFSFEITAIKLVIDGKDTPWLAYTNATDGNINVFKYSQKASAPGSGTWASASPQPLATGGSDDCSIGCTTSQQFAVSGAGQPYVAYTVWVADPVLFFMPADNCTSYVKRLEGDAWVTTAQLKGKVALNDGIGLALSPTAPYEPIIKWGVPLPVGQPGPVLRQQGSDWKSVATVSNSVTFNPDRPTNFVLTGSAAKPYIAYVASGNSATGGNTASKTIVATPQNGAWEQVASRNMPVCGLTKAPKKGYVSDWVRSKLIVTTKALYFFCNEYNGTSKEAHVLKAYSLRLPAMPMQAWVGLGGVPAAVNATLLESESSNTAFDAQVAANGRVYVAYLDSDAGNRITVARF